jgi:hypothetical protein
MFFYRQTIFSILLIVAVLAMPAFAFKHSPQTKTAKKASRSTNLTGTTYVKPYVRKGKMVRGYVRKSAKRKPSNRF